jgi:hypothetical protein
MIASTAKRQRIAYCECGARLAGGSQGELFEAAERHIACHHPQWLPARRASSLATVVPSAKPVSGTAKGCADSGVVAKGGR